MAAATTPASDLLTYEQAAEYLGVTVSAVKQAVSIGRIPTVKLPRNARKFVTREALDAYRERRYQRVPASTPQPVSAPVPGLPGGMSEAINIAASPFIQLADKIAGPMGTAVTAAIMAYAQGVAPYPKQKAG